MNRLKNILLAGTLVPTLVLPQTATSWAQAPGGLERGGAGGGEGGPRGGGAGMGGARGGGEGGPHGGAGGGEGGPRGGGAGMGGAHGGGEGGPHAGAGGFGGGAVARPERAAPRAERPENGAGGRAEHAPAAGRAGAEPGEGHGARQERQAPAAAERTREPAAERTREPAAERHAPAAAERAAPASRAAPAERAGAAGREPGEHATERTKAGRGAEAPAAGRGAETPAERAAERPGAAGRAATSPAERAGERPDAAGRAAETPAERAAERTHSGARGAETPAERAAGRPGAGATPAARDGERPGAAGRTGERPGAPGAAAGREGTPGQPGRFNDPASPQGGGFRNGDNSRGNAAAAGRAPGPNGQDNNGLGNGDQNRGLDNNRDFNRGTDNHGFDNRGGDGRGSDNRGGDRGDRGDRRGGISPGGAAAIGAAAGFAGGFLAATGARDLDGIRRDRREDVEDGRTYIREPGRTIVNEGGGRAFIVHDENDRFRDLGYDVRRERRGDDFVDTIDRPGGEQILTFTTRDGRMLRRVRRSRDGREVVLIDNAYDGGIRPYDQDVVDLPPPRYDIPRDRYIVDYNGADESSIYDTLIAPPVQAPPRRYTLDQIRYSPDIRRYVRSVDINTINFASGSWVVPASATGKLRTLGGAIKRAVGQNPNSVFLVEGYTDATGNPNDNLSLSDRRAQSVAAILSKDFGVPPENLTTQGYGQQNPKVNTSGPSVENRRVVVQNITQLMADNGGNAPPR